VGLCVRFSFCCCCTLEVLRYSSAKLPAQSTAQAGIESKATAVVSERWVFHIDKVRFSDFPLQEYAVTGWCGTGRLEAPAELWLEAGGHRVPCLIGGDRPDVSQYFGPAAMRKCGFAARIAVSCRRIRLEFFPQEAGGEPLFTLLDASVWESAEEKGDSYRDWLRKREAALFWVPGKVSAELSALRHLPLISVILPTLNTGVYHLHRCVGSVLSQKYANWELCIRDDGSWDTRTLDAFEKLSALDPRISVMFHARNGKTSASVNRALESVQGEFAVLLDHEDELHPYALLEVVRQLNLTPETDLIYSDEDRIDQAGLRSQPAFKPAYDEDLLLAFNYIGHLVCIRKTLLCQCGGGRDLRDGADNWELLLRVAELTIGPRIQHIAKPLYHWRETASLDAKPYAQAAKPYAQAAKPYAQAAKPYAQAARRRVVQDCLNRRKVDALVEDGLFPGSMRVKRQMPQQGGVAVFTRLEHGDQQRALTRVNRPKGARFYELSVSLIYDVEDPERRPLLTWDEIDASVLIFLNCPLDNLNHDSLCELARQCQRGDCGLVGGTIVDHEKRIVTGSLMAQSESVLLNPADGEPLSSTGYMGLFKAVRSVPFVSPCLFAASSRLVAGIGGWNLISSGAWDELCGRAAEECHRQQLKILFTPYAVAEARRPRQRSRILPGNMGIPASLTLNSNITTFPDMVGMLQGRN
jgi:hypothetical protein